MEPQLHDIHLPTNPDIWPLALGWWLLLALILIAAVYLILKISKFLRIKRHKQLLINEYKSLETKLVESPNKNLITETNVLLRRLALAYYPNQNIASLTGSNWLDFLDVSGKTQDFSRGAGRILIDAPYRADELENYNGDEFIPLVRKWVMKTVNSSVKNRANLLNNYKEKIDNLSIEVNEKNNKIK